MNKYLFYLGIDMGKSNFNYTLMDEEENILLEGKVINQPDQIIVWIEQLINFKPNADLFSTCLVHCAINSFIF